MQTKYFLAGILVLAFAAGEILLLRRRAEFQVRAATLTRTEADKRIAYQWRLFKAVALIGIVWGIASLSGLL